MNSIILKVGLISFFADISSELLYPITPIFLTTLLGASMTSLGLIEGLADLVASFLKAYVGKKSDRVGKRKPFVWIGYLISTLSKAFIGFATSWVGVLIARILDRVGKGVRTAPRDALIAESVPKEKLGFAFGVHRAMDTLGAVIGPLVALYLLKQWGESNLRSFYFIAIVPGLFAVGLALFLPESVRVLKKTVSELPVSISFKRLPRSYFLFLGAWGLFSMVNSSDAFLILKATKSGHSLIETIFMYVLFNLVYALSSPFLGKCSDKIGKKQMLKFALVVFAFVYFGFGFSLNPWILFACYGLFMGMSEGIGKALVADTVPAHLQSELGGTAQGIFGMVTGICTLIASITAGLLWDHLGGVAPFFYGGVGAVLTFIVFLFLL